MFLLFYVDFEISELPNNQLYDFEASKKNLKVFSLNLKISVWKIETTKIGQNKDEF